MNLVEVELPDVEIRIADDIFIKQMLCKMAGTIVEQHVHAYDHVLMVALGSFRIWRDGVDLGAHKAPTGLVIKAGTKHMLVSDEPNSIAYCIHNISRSGEVEIVPSEQLLRV